MRKELSKLKEELIDGNSLTLAVLQKDQQSHEMSGYTSHIKHVANTPSIFFPFIFHPFTGHCLDFFKFHRFNIFESQKVKKAYMHMYYFDL